MQYPWLKYANQGATRNQALSPELVKALGFLPDLGVTAEVFSGGQDPFGVGYRRTGSTRHDSGNAADVRFYKDGRLLDYNNPEDLPTYTQIVQRGKQAGLTGFGAGPGYMSPGSMHVGFGKPGVWGRGGRGANAPEWLRTAYNTPLNNDIDQTVNNIQTDSAKNRVNNRVDQAFQDVGEPSATLSATTAQPEARPVNGMGRGSGMGGQGGFRNFLTNNRGLLLGLGADLLARGMDTRRGFSGRGMLAGSISDDRRSGRQAEAERAQQQANVTAQYLESMGADPAVVDLARQGMGAQAMSEFTRMNQAPDATSGMKEYNMAVDQGYEGSFMDFKRDTRAGTTVNVGPQGQTLAKPPAGYGIRRNADGTPFINPETQTVEFVQIPGGPVAAKTAAAEAGAEQAKAQKETSANIVVDDIDRAIKQIQDSPKMTTGVGGAVTQGIPGTPAFNVNALLDTVRANAGFDRLQAMRDASPTGGALGQVSNIELNLLQSAIGNLALAQNEEQLIENLQRVRQIYSDIIHGPESSKGMTNEGPVWKDLGDGIKVREISR